MEGSKREHCGGGGCGMSWPEEGRDRVWPGTKDSKLAGMYLLDTLKPESLWLSLGS